MRAKFIDTISLSQMKPSFVPTKDVSSKANTTKMPKPKKGDIPIAVTTQLWQRSGSCPDGTVPIRRVPRNSAYETRKPSIFNQTQQPINNTEIKLLHEHRSVMQSST